MDKKIIYIIIAVLVLGIGGFLLLGGKSSKPQTNPTTQTEAQTTAAPSAQQSLKELLTAGGAKKCTFNVAESNSTGTIYVGNSKMRGDFSTTTNGKSIGSHMIVDGTTSYIWMDNQTQGFKMSWDNMEKPQVTPTAQTQNGVDVNKKFDYKCDNWIVDNSQLTLPSGIDFKDMSALMPKVTGGAATNTSAGGTMDKCSACNSLTGDSKAQCLKALSCN